MAPYIVLDYSFSPPIDDTERSTKHASFFKQHLAGSGVALLMQTCDCDSHNSRPSIWRSRRVLLAGDITMFIVYGEIAPSDVMSLGEGRAYSNMRDDSLPPSISVQLTHLFVLSTFCCDRPIAHHEIPSQHHCYSAREQPDSDSACKRTVQRIWRRPAH